MRLQHYRLYSIGSSEAPVPRSVAKCAGIYRQFNICGDVIKSTVRIVCTCARHLNSMFIVESRRRPRRPVRDVVGRYISSARDILLAVSKSRRYACIMSYAVLHLTPITSMIRRTRGEHMTIAIKARTAEAQKLIESSLRATTTQLATTATTPSTSSGSLQYQASIARIITLLLHYAHY